MAGHQTSMTEPNRKLKVLVVDDNPDVATMLAMLVRMSGCETEIVNDGASAICKALVYLPNLILLDIGMPHIGGLEVCRAIRETPEGQSMTIVAQTGWGSESDILRTKEAGFDGHLVKPIDFGTLKRVLDDASERL
jgi:CheY-like chemotaxis protein